MYRTCNRALLALGVGSLLWSGHAVAQNPLADIDLEIYGRAHLDFGYLDDGDDYGAFNISSRTSRIGLRAGHQVLNDLRVLGQVERQVDIDGNSSSLPARNTFIGLEGSWGRVRGGFFDTPTKNVRNAVALFGTQLGDMRNIVRNNYLDGDGARLQGFDERFRKSIAYTSPDFAGFTLDTQYSVETESNSESSNNNDNDGWSVAVNYRSGDAYVGLGHERNNKEESGVPNRHVTRLGAYYDIGPLRITGLAQTASNPDDKAYGAGLRYALTPQWALKTQYYRLDADVSGFDADLVAVGVDWRPVSSVLIYLNLAQVDNSRNQTLTPWRQSSTVSRNGSAGDTARGAVVGMMYNF